jgi:F-type H+-transporting ATPase subunit b
MTFHLWTFLFEMINFVVLAYVLHRLLYRPLQKAVDERRQASIRIETEALKAQHEAEALREQFKSKLADIEVHRQSTIRQARDQAVEERTKLLRETDQLVQRRLDDERKSLERERAEAYQGLGTEIVHQAVDLTERFLLQAADRTLNDQMALRLVDTLQEMPSAEQHELRELWHPKDGAVLESATELNDGTKGKIVAAVAGLLGQEVNLTVQTNPVLLGGVRLRIGGQVWDASLAGSLEQARFGFSEAPAHA